MTRVDGFNNSLGWSLRPLSGVEIPPNSLARGFRRLRQTVRLTVPEILLACWTKVASAHYRW